MKVVCRAMLLMLAGVASAPGLSASYQSGDYPSLALSRLTPQSATLAASNNLISRAVEQHHAIPLQFDGSFKANVPYLFPSELFPNQYAIDKIAQRDFVVGMGELVEAFVCAEYRFRTRQAQAFACQADQNPRVSATREGMPFVSGTYLTQNLTVDKDNRRNGVSYQFYLPSGEAQSLNSAFGSVHQLGTFFGRFANSDSLVLAVRFNAFKLDSQDWRGDALNPNPVIYYIVLPTVTELVAQGGQQSAARFARQQAKLLVLGK